MKKAMNKLGTFAHLVLWTYAGIAIGSDPAQMMNSQIPLQTRKQKWRNDETTDRGSAGVRAVPGGKRRAGARRIMCLTIE